MEQTLLLEKYWDNAIKSGQIAGGVIMLKVNGKLIYNTFKGHSNLANNEHVNDKTTFRLASLSKLITSIAVLKLIQMRKIALSDPITKYLDLKSTLYNVVTIEHLLNHTSGIEYSFEQGPHSPYRACGFTDGLDASLLSVEDNLDLIAKAGLLHEPGKRWAYSYSTDVLGRLIEVVNHQSLEDALKSLVFKPLNINEMSFFPDENLSEQYNVVNGVLEHAVGDQSLVIDSGTLCFSDKRMLQSMSYQSGGAGLIGHSDDYFKIMDCIANDGYPILKNSDNLRKNTLPFSILNRMGWGHSFGSMILTDPKLANVEQGKGTWGWCGVYGSHYWVDPINNISLLCLTNTSVAGAWGKFVDGLKATIYQTIIKTKD